MMITMVTRRSLSNSLLLSRAALLPSNKHSLATTATTNTAVPDSRIHKSKIFHPSRITRGFYSNRRHHATMATDTDLYPTRLSDGFEMRLRPDPVVWSDHDATTGPFSPQELDFYKTNGYIVVEGLFDAHEIQTCREKFTRLQEDFEEDIDSNKKDTVITDDNLCIVEPGSTKLRTIYDIHKIHPVAYQLSRDVRVLGRVQQILDSDVYIHHGRINFQQRFKGTGFYWHSDFESWHAEDGMASPRCLSCVILMMRNVPQNGALMVIPGSHKHYISCAGPTPDNHWEVALYQQQTTGVPNHQMIARMVEEGGIQYCTGEPGSVIFFDGNLMHGSHTNITPWDRMNLFLAYNSVNNRLGQPYGPTKLRPEHISARDPAWVKPYVTLHKPTEY